MSTRIAVFVTALGLLPGLVLAQTPPLPAGPRGPITGLERYEIPGILRIDGRRVTGSASVTIEEAAVRVASPATGRPLIVLRPGQRPAGMALEVKDRIVEFLPDGQRDALSIPPDSIGRLEVSEFRAGPRVLRGIVVGIAAFYGVGWLIVAQCGLGCHDGLLAVAIGGGTVAGAVAGRGREHWKTVPADWLLSAFGPAAAVVPRPTAHGAETPPPNRRFAADGGGTLTQHGAA